MNPSTQILLPTFPGLTSLTMTRKPGPHAFLKAISGKKGRLANMFPTRIQLSKKTWDRLQYMQTKTRLTPNVMARIAISLALRDIRTASINASKPEQTHVINRDVLFGDQEKAYEALIRQFYAEQKIN